MMGLVPTPVLTVVRVAGQDAITDSLSRFGKITQLRLKLVEPNDETDASAAVAAVEQSLRPLEPARLEVVVAGSKGLNQDAVAKAVTEVTEGQNTHVIVDGEDEAGLKMQADNDEFALSVPIKDPPADDEGLTETLFDKYQTLSADGKVKGLAQIAHIAQKILKLAQLL